MPGWTLPVKRILAVSALAILVSCSPDRDSPTGPAPAPTEPIRYTAVGASDALGTGSSVECLPLVECPNGMGYVFVIARTLQAGRTVTLLNLGLPAAVLSPRIQALGQRYGRTIPFNFMEHELPFVSRESNVVTVFAGGNDANAVGRAVDGGEAGSNVNAFVDDQVRLFAAEYRTLISGIRDRAGNPRLVVANLPNFAGVPYTSDYTVERKRGIQTLSVRFSAEGINTLTASGVAVVDLLCNPRAYEPSFYSRDGYHPSDAGYAFLASEMVRAITDSAYPAPRSDCPQMRIVP
jgi:lysophospholipase L1-like esterase